MNLIEVRNLTQIFGTHVAVDSVSFNVPKGSIFGLLGPNGVGKTTIIYMVLGLLTPSGGRVRVFDLDVRHHGDEIRAKTGVLLEYLGLYERLSAEDNLIFYARIARMSRAEYEPRIQSLLTDLELWDRRKDPVYTWSRGMKQRLALARALIPQPQLLILDEPTAGLDPIVTNRLHDQLKSLTSTQSVTIFLTTHNLMEAEILCDQVGIMYHGKLVSLDTPQRLLSDQRGLQKIFLQLEKEEMA